MDLLIELFTLLLVVPMTNMLVAIAHVFGGNFGIAIILFTIMMKFITWPLTASQFRQSRAMQAMQPKLAELQKKYKGKDPKKLQAETMQLYREAGFNPLGCLFPLLVQMPIWIALYQVIRLSLGETPESFVTLSQRLYPIPFIHSAVPLNNNFLYWNLGQPDSSLVLPVLVALTMYIQQKMITPTPAPAATQQQAQQQQTQQMMTWMLPLMFAFWSLNVPSGLALYWFMSNLTGVVTQYFYLGRRVDWSSMLRFGPPAQTAGKAAVQPARGADKGGGKPKDASEAKDDRPEQDAAQQAAAEQDAAPVAVTGASGSRRKRNARRRSKR